MSFYIQTFDEVILPNSEKTILVIGSDISAELSLNNLAKKQRISSGYLAAVFKKETGRIVSEYIAPANKTAKEKSLKNAMFSRLSDGAGSRT